MALGRAAALCLLCLCVTTVAVGAKKEHVKVLLGQTEFEEAIKVRVYGTADAPPQLCDACTHHIDAIDQALPLAWHESCCQAA